MQSLQSESTGGERLASLFWVPGSVTLSFSLSVEDTERQQVSQRQIPSSPVLGDKTEKHVHIPPIRAETRMALGLLQLSVREVWPKQHWLRMESRVSLMTGGKQSTCQGRRHTSDPW